MKNERIVAPMLVVIENRETYEMTAAMVEYCERPKEGTHDSMFGMTAYKACQLFQVVLSDKSIHYCLAESAESAISQSSCEKTGIDIERSEMLERGAVAIRLPYRIRGWSSTDF